MMPTPETTLRQAHVSELNDSLSSASITDTLSRTAAADSSSHALLDTLFWEQFRLISPQEEEERPFNPYLTKEEAYGSSSELVVAQLPVQPYREVMTDHPLFQGGVLMLAAAYFLLVCSHINDWKSLFGRRRGNEGGGITSRAVHTLVIIGLLLVVALGVRLFELGGITAYGTLTLLLAGMIVVMAILLFQYVFLFLIGHITISRELIRNLIRIKRDLFALGSLFMTPIALMTLLCPPGEGNGWLYLLGGMGGLALLLFIKESFTLFLAKKIPILHWFLYLCAVECFPISLIVLMAIRW